MATVRHLGLFPRSWGCPLTEEQLAAKFPDYYATYGMTAYPLPMSKAAAVASYWKVRKWKVRATATEGESFQTVDFTFTSVAASVRHLVCESRGFTTEFEIVAESGELLPTSWSEVNWGLHDTVPIISNGSFYPAISFALAAYEDATFGGLGAFAGLALHNLVSANSTIELSFAGFRFDLPAFQAVDSGPGGVGSTVVEFIRAEELWSYS